MSVKVVAFDMGGVMVRSFDTFPSVVEQYHIGGQEKVLLYRMLEEMCRGFWSEDDFWAMFSRQTGIKIAVPKGGLILRSFQPKLDQDTVDLVLRLKKAGYRVICATNTIALHYGWHTAHGQYSMFDKVYASHLMHEVKPEKGFYQAVVAGEQVEPGEIFFCDDNMPNVIGARDCGLLSEQYLDAGQIGKVLENLGVRC